MAEIEDRGYSNPDVLVSTQWVEDNLNSDKIRLIESNEDQLLYPAGHIPGAVEVDWIRDLNDSVRRDYIEQKGFEELVSRIGITPETTLVFYGDKNNWWACYAFWVFQLFGHTNAKVMDGGKLKWEKEGRPLTKDVAKYAASEYPTSARDDSAVRAFRDDVLEHVQKGLPLIDVRSPEEYSGVRLHMEGYPNEGALRGGHIPGAKNVPWAKAIDPDDGTFLSANELISLYVQQQQVDSKDEVIVYCRIGERSSHTWFVLSYLLGFPKVRNYDGSWTEWGNLVGVPVER